MFSVSKDELLKEMQSEASVGMEEAHEEMRGGIVDVPPTLEEDT
jgi:hypothetical protein